METKGLLFGPIGLEREGTFISAQNSNGRSKEVDKVQMKRLILVTVLKICGKAILITLFAGIAIGVIGYTNPLYTSSICPAILSQS